MPSFMRTKEALELLRRNRKKGGALPFSQPQAPAPGSSVFASHATITDEDRFADARQSNALNAIFEFDAELPPPPSQRLPLDKIDTNDFFFQDVPGSTAFTAKRMRGEPTYEEGIYATFDQAPPPPAIGSATRGRPGGRESGWKRERFWREEEERNPTPSPEEVINDFVGSDRRPGGSGSLPRNRMPEMDSQAAPQTASPLQDEYSGKMVFTLPDGGRIEYDGDDPNAIRAIQKFAGTQDEPTNPFRRYNPMTGQVEANPMPGGARMPSEAQQALEQFSQARADRVRPAEARRRREQEETDTRRTTSFERAREMQGDRLASEEARARTLGEAEVTKAETEAQAKRDVQELAGRDALRIEEFKARAGSPEHEAKMLTLALQHRIEENRGRALDAQISYNENEQAQSQMAAFAQLGAEASQGEADAEAGKLVTLMDNFINSGGVLQIQGKDYTYEQAKKAGLLKGVLSEIRQALLGLMPEESRKEYDKRAMRQVFDMALGIERGEK